MVTAAPKCQPGRQLVAGAREWLKGACGGLHHARVLEEQRKTSIRALLPVGCDASGGAQKDRG